jgi:hypothetical protein
MMTRVLHPLVPKLTGPDRGLKRTRKRQEFERWIGGDSVAPGHQDNGLTGTPEAGDQSLDVFFVEGQELAPDKTQIECGDVPRSVQRLIQSRLAD